MNNQISQPLASTHTFSLHKPMDTFLTSFFPFYLLFCPVFKIVRGNDIPDEFDKKKRTKNIVCVNLFGKNELYVRSWSRFAFFFPYYNMVKKNTKQKQQKPFLVYKKISIAKSDSISSIELHSGIGAWNFELVANSEFVLVFVVLAILLSIFLFVSSPKCLVLLFFFV